MRSLFQPALRITIAAVTLLALPRASALAADPVTLRLNLPPGTSWVFETTQVLESRNKANFNGHSTEYAMTLTSRRAGTVDVLASPAGEPTSLRVMFDESCENNMTMGQQGQKLPFAYAGKTVTVTRNADGTVSDDFLGQADPRSVSELRAMLVQGRLIFPRQAVAVGEEWKADPKLLARVTDLKGDDHAGMTLQLLDVTDDNGKRVAKRKVSAAIQKSARGMNSTVLMQGIAVVDLATGHTIRSELKGPVESKGGQQGPGPDGRSLAYQVEGNGTVTVTCSARLVTLGREPARRSAATDAGPAAAGNPPGPGATGERAARTPEGYEVVATTAAGGALASRKPRARSVRAALASALPDLAGYFDGRPKVSGAYEDVRDHRSGGAAFTATFGGQPVRGMISCKLLEQGAALAVVYTKADATPEDWDELTASAPGAAPRVQPLRTYQFPDNTGSVGLPDGWKTDATTCNGTVVIKGPAGQVVTMGLFFTVVTPDSMAIRTHQGLVAHARQWGTPPPSTTFLVAPYGRPVDTFQEVLPQLNGLLKASGRPGFEVDHLEHQGDPAAVLPHGRAALVTYGISEVDGGRRKHSRVLAQIEADPVTNETFIFWLTGAAAPDATFDRDLPTMLAIIASLRENAEVLQASTREHIALRNRLFAARQKAHQERVAAYEQYNRSQQRDSTIRSRANDDFVEAIRGYRTVEDTRTGEKRQVNLGNVDRIVDRLNHVEPGRYRQIPLRDELDPLSN